MNEYDIEKAFAAIEEELIASMMRNMKRHKEWELAEGFQWTMWQADQLKALDKYKKQNSKKFQRKFNEINRSIKELIEEARKQGNMDQELEILDAIQNGWKPPRRLSSDMTTAAEFFKLNTRKLEALITATENDFKKAETAMLRMANDQYRQVIFNAQVYANTGAGTYEKAVDMATRDFRARGLNCIEYKNGARHTMKDYARMAIRTAAKRAYLTGEGEKRQEWGISTVIMNKRGNPCPLCLPFVGKILIDDVWSGGKAEDGPYPLMSSAVAAGLYHPNCKDSHSTYFQGLSNDKISYSESDMDFMISDYKDRQKALYAKKQAEKYKRMADLAVDPENKKKYEEKYAVWTEKAVIGTKNIIENAFDEFKQTLAESSTTTRYKMIMQMSSEFVELIEDRTLQSPFSYIPGEDCIKYNPAHKLILNYDFQYVFAHEMSHRLDTLMYKSWDNDSFRNAIEDCQKALYNMRNEVEGWFEPGGKYAGCHELASIFSSISAGRFKLPAGHSEEYFEKNIRRQPAEVFADLGALLLTKQLPNDEILKEIVKVYREIIYA